MYNPSSSALSIAIALSQVFQPIHIENLNLTFTLQADDPGGS
jgi:hypothetical protein